MALVFDMCTCMEVHHMSCHVIRVQWLARCVLSCDWFSGCWSISTYQSSNHLCIGTVNSHGQSLWLISISWWFRPFAVGTTSSVFWPVIDWNVWDQYLDQEWCPPIKIVTWWGPFREEISHEIDERQGLACTRTECELSLIHIMAWNELGLQNRL